MVQEYQSYQM